MNTLQQFVDARPHVTKQGIAEDSGLSYQTVIKIINGSMQMTPRSETLLRPVYKKYGWKPASYDFEKVIVLDEDEV